MHIDCTETGALPPTSTPPTFSCREIRRGARGLTGGSSGSPRLTVVTSPQNLSVESGRAMCSSIERVGDGVGDVGEQDQRGDSDNYGQDAVGQRHQLGKIDRAANREVAAPPNSIAQLLVPQDRNVAAVEWEEREEVEQADEDVDRGDDADQR